MGFRNLEELQYKMVGKSPEYCMRMLHGNYTGSTKIVPEPNKYYTFVYNPKTPNIEYDQHPLIMSGDVFPWGFTGYNVHWGEIRRYVWAGSSNLLEMTEQEFQIVSQFPLARFKVS